MRYRCRGYAALGGAGGSDVFQVNLFYSSVDGVCTFRLSLTEACLVVVSSYSLATVLLLLFFFEEKNPRSKKESYTVT